MIGTLTAAGFVVVAYASPAANQGTRDAAAEYSAACTLMTIVAEVPASASAVLPVAAVAAAECIALAVVVGFAPAVFALEWAAVVCAVVAALLHHRTGGGVDVDKVAGIHNLP